MWEAKVYIKYRNEASPCLLGLLDGRHSEESLKLPGELRGSLVPDPSLVALPAL